MTDHVGFAVRRNLRETRRRPAGLCVQIKRVEYGGGSLRWKTRCIFRHPPQVIHLPGRQKLAHVGPAFGAFLRAHLHQPVPGFDNLQFVSVLHCRRNRRPEGQILPKVQGAGTDVSVTDRTCFRRLIAARNEDSEGEAGERQGESAIKNHERVLLVYQ